MTTDGNTYYTSPVPLTVTTDEIRRRTGNALSTITRTCRALGYTKIGRDWHLTPKQAESVIAAMHQSRGRPKRTNTGGRHE